MSTASIIEGIMRGFAERTGLSTAEHPAVRYLWTDAFAVCNFLELFRSSGDKRDLQQALALVDQVHQILGQHREDDERQGWLCGLGEAEGAQHPTRGGLRIGKRLPERRGDEPFDEGLEWDRDGQYFHYLTKWMHALDRVARTSRDPIYIRWAHELAMRAHTGFVYEPRAGARKQMVWKMSIDLTYPLVPSMGHHDPLDGLITYRQIEATARELGLPSGECDLAAEIADMEAMCRGVSWRTHDALGIGGLLIDACRLATLIADSSPGDSDRLEFLLHEAGVSLDALSQMRPLDEPLKYRLAFREFGLSIGLRGANHIRSLLDRHPESFPNRHAILDKLSRLTPFQPWVDAIELFWQDPAHQRGDNWQAHRDINSVMLATSLAPDGFFGLQGSDFQAGAR